MFLMAIPVALCLRNSGSQTPDCWLKLDRNTQVPNREVRNIIISRIMIKIDDSDTGIIIEVKYSETNDLEMDCKKALRQVDETGYSEALHQEDVHKILKYGIACRRKDCRVILETEY